ncbi:hypothetical protein PR202_ga23835 [Eleusine coracana subsp. coracana]|uniref:RRM domain-containing protein n=1 Tax=Eleusine coracana subsp. coracana TaxID=191504 RepID=A0AAV5D778_ELECO|nr:hypothetical protein PR202_ga23835 [Eleusine coracana subsp. coracana]
MLCLVGLAVPPATKIRQMAGNNNPWRVPVPSLLNARGGLGDTGLFSTSLPVLPHEKLNFPDSAHGTPLMDDSSTKMKVFDDDTEDKDYKFDFDLRQIDDLLPDEDELFAGITDEIEPTGQTNNTEELEEFDVFGSSGGIELDVDPVDSITASLGNSNIGDGVGGNGINPFGLTSTVGTVAGEHPYGEHPSRTLFVRNINSNVEDSELRSLFENKPLRRRKLDIHFSIPKENPSDKDLNQGTLVIFNLDPSVSNEDVRRIFGAYGEVKEIRETPNKKHHKFIEFYDVRASEAALRSLNKSEIAGKRIKLEPSRPGGTRRKYDYESPTGNGMSPIGMSSLMSNAARITPIGKDSHRYTSKMLLSAIDEFHKGTYDFFYLPIDFKNKCNVGYAFINMISPVHIISFFQAFNGKKWEKFNSEKVASLAYARIQGRTALISHFQNSSLNEDKRCRPILFHPNGSDTGNQEAFPINGMCIHMPLEDATGDSLDNEEDSNNSAKIGESSIVGSM